jgi:chaperone required for assembly of F1-ATPase
MKRFYKTAEAGTAPGGHVVRLDGKLLKTPLHNNLILSSPVLAAEIAREWQAQKNNVVPASMPMTQLANTMVDKAAGPERGEMNRQVAAYGASDLLCYHAAWPPDLAKRHKELWLPLLEWMKSRFGTELKSVSGIRYLQQPEDSLKKIEKIVRDLNAADFTAVQAVTAATGSVVIALALLEQRLDAEGAWQAACVDEFYQLEKWGEDALARARLDKIRAELQEAWAFLQCFLKSG